MHELMLVLVLAEDMNSVQFKHKLKLYCEERGLNLVQCAAQNPVERQRVTTRIQGSKRNLMNLRESQFFEKQLQPLVETEGSIRECHTSSSED